MMFPAIVGGSFLLADGIITPPISASSAIEGLRIYSPHLDTVPIVLEDPVKNREAERTSRYPALQKYDVPGDLRFVLTHSFLSYENDLSFGKYFVLRAYYFLRRWLSIREDEAFGLDTSNVVIENVPLVVSPLGNAPLKREF